MKPKLVFLSAFLSPYRSGAEAMVEEVSTRLTDAFDVTIVTGRYSRSLPKNDTLGGKVKVVRVGLGFAFDKWLYSFLAPMQLGALRPDVIHAVLETFAGLALWMCRCKALKVLTLQTTNRAFLKKMIIRYPDVVTAISTDLQTLAASYGRTDVVVIPNGIDLTAIQAACASSQKDATRALFVGRLEPMKGIDALLRAFALVTRDASPHLHLRIVGDGSQMSSLKKLSRTLGLEERVTFVGRVTGEKLFEEYARAAIFCGLSRSEALGNVFLEAQAAGCAVLATSVGGIPEIVQHGKTGLLVPVDQVDEAARVLGQLFTDESLRITLSSAARVHAEGYDWSVITKRYKEILQRKV